MGGARMSIRQKPAQRELDPLWPATHMASTPVKSHLTLMGRSVPGQWTVERLPNEVEQGNETYRYLAPTGLCVLETIRPYEDGKTWHHVSASFPDRLPTWEDLGMVKRIFMGNNVTALQIFPPASRYVSLHPYVLHLWRCLDGDVTPEFSRVIDGVRHI